MSACLPAEILERIINFLPLPDLWAVRCCSLLCRDIVAARSDFRRYRRIAILAARVRTAIHTEIARLVVETLLYDITIPRFLPFRTVTPQQLDYVDRIIAPRRLPQDLRYLYMCVGGQDCVVENVPLFRIRMLEGRTIYARMLSIKYLVNEVTDRGELPNSPPQRDSAPPPIPFAETDDGQDILALSGDGKKIYMIRDRVTLDLIIEDRTSALRVLLDESGSVRVGDNLAG